jgi:hypothetical protein
MATSRERRCNAIGLARLSVGLDLSCRAPPGRRRTPPATQAVRVGIQICAMAGGTSLVPVGGAVVQAAFGWLVQLGRPDYLP